MVSSLSPLIAIVGETASGKSALAMAVARKFSGEIICADSRTVYKGMDIGTAKPSAEDQAAVRHHLLDVVKPDQKYTVVNFQGSTLESIKRISERGRLPILVGGTGLYVDSVLYNLDFHSANEERDELNPRHQKGGSFPLDGKILRPNSLLIGISMPKEMLEERIVERVEQMFKDGLEQEVKNLADKYGWEAAAMSATGYIEWRRYFAGKQTLEQTKELIIIHTRQYAKRQRTWFKRNKSIQWVSSSDEALEIAGKFLANPTTN